MRKTILSLQMTLDGYSTVPNDEMDYIPPFNDERMWHDIHEEMWKNLEAVDTLILGRRTHEIWEQILDCCSKQSSEH